MTISLSLATHDQTLRVLRSLEGLRARVLTSAGTYDNALLGAASAGAGTLRLFHPTLRGQLVGAFYVDVPLARINEIHVL